MLKRIFLSVWLNEEIFETNFSISAEAQSMTMTDKVYLTLIFKHEKKRRI